MPLKHPQNRQGTGEATRFQKGASGNPGGRPKLSDDIKALAKSKSKRAFERIVELIESDDERVAFAAAKEVIDRAYGKARPADDGENADKSVVINIVRCSEAGEASATVSVRSFDTPVSVQ
jgi:hypothetical protein